MARLLALHGPDLPGPRDPDDPGSIARDATDRHAGTRLPRERIALSGAAIPFVEASAPLPVRESRYRHARLYNVAANTLAGYVAADAGRPAHTARHRFVQHRHSPTPRLTHHRENPTWIFARSRN